MGVVHNQKENLSGNLIRNRKTTAFSGTYAKPQYY